MSKTQDSIGRLVSAKVKPASGSVTSIAGPQPVVEVITLPAVAACAGILVLLLLAGVGIYFAIKQNALKANHPARVAIPAIVVQAPPERALPTAQPVPKSKIVEPSVPANSIPINQQPTLPESLPTAAPSREPGSGNVIGREPNPPAPTERPRPEATLEPPIPPMPIAEVVKRRPVDIGRLPLPVKPELDPKGERFGTGIDFLPTPFDAYEQVKKHSDKLAMIVHYGGSFERGRFLSDNVEAFRTGTLMDREVANFVNEQLFNSTQRVALTKAANGGQAASVVTYFCRSDGTVLHAIAGPVDAKQFLREAEWIIDTRKSAIAEMKGSLVLYANYFNKAHRDRYFASSSDDDGPFNPMRRPGPVRKGGPPAPGPGGFGGFGGFPIPGGFPPDFPGIGGFGGFRGFAEPLPPAARKLPAQRPAVASAQAQVHWLLASRNLPKLGDIDKIIYPALMRERNGE